MDAIQRMPQCRKSNLPLQSPDSRSIGVTADFGTSVLFGKFPTAPEHGIVTCAFL